MSKNTRRINKCIDMLSELAEQYLKDHCGIDSIKLNKKQSSFTEYQHTECKIDRILYSDRSHPVDSVIINEFNQKTGASLENVKIIYGSASNEYTRSNHALALATMSGILFRNGAYKPETEEGRKLLTHELTHIAQFKEEGRIFDKEELEIEAEENEKKEEFSSDPIETANFAGRSYKIRRSLKKEIEECTEQKLENLIEQQENFMTEESYLELLIKYARYRKLCM
ncbi:MAG: DUF4157 domain-containing protein [Spirochaetales bacterium]|nr:DUF4157 domain-containing protein [Spirochaetales bacterium]